MSKVFIEESTLTSIGNAIREKNGTTELIAPLDMAGAIEAIEAGGSGGGGYEPTDAELTYQSYSNNGVCDYRNYQPFADGANYWILQQYGDRCKFSLYFLTTGFFARFKYKCFDVNLPNYTSDGLSSLFSGSTPLEEITGSLCGNNSRTSRLSYMFSGCNRLRTINDNFLNADTFQVISNNASYYGEYQGMFQNCYSLRELPRFYIDMKEYRDGGISRDIKLSGASYWYSYTFYNCYALNKIENLRVVLSQLDGSVLKYNGFDGTFNNCHNLSKLTFDTNADGTPKVAAWNKQTIDLSQYVGYASSSGNLYNYNSGIIVNYQIPNTTEDRFLQTQWLNPSMSAEKLNDRHSFEANSAKYGRTEAVETINSLPDTSAAGGGNTIKFKGAQGKYTDWMRCRTDDSTYDSSISTLTEEEIAVAATKGWTVTLV